MSRAHVYPSSEEDKHCLSRSADCICEPKVLDQGFDISGQRALVFVHSPLTPNGETKEMLKRYE